MPILVRGRDGATGGCRPPLSRGTGPAAELSAVALVTEAGVEPAPPRRRRSRRRAYAIFRHSARLVAPEGVEPSSPRSERGPYASSGTGPRGAGYPPAGLFGSVRAGSDAQLDPDRPGPARAGARLAAATGGLAGSAHRTVHGGCSFRRRVGWTPLPAPRSFGVRHKRRVVRGAGSATRYRPAMPEPFRYTVSADDEVHVLLRFPDGEIVTVRVQAGSELLLDGPPGKPDGGDGGGTGNRTPPA